MVRNFKNVAEYEITIKKVIAFKYINNNQLEGMEGYNLAIITRGNFLSTHSSFGGNGNWKWAKFPRTI